MEALLLQNFKNVAFLNEHYPENLPTHKHFRLYDEKHLVPGVQYLNQFFYPRYEDFYAHIRQLTGEDDLNVIVVTKNPYAWYKSYYEWAHKRPRWKRKVIQFLRNEANAHFLLEWNLFTKKWFDFQKENPNKVKVVRYEDLVTNLMISLEKIQTQFRLQNKSENWLNVSKVGMSKAFNEERKSYYASSQYMQDIPLLHFRAITEALDKTLMNELGYEWIPSATTLSIQMNKQS